MHAFRSFVRDFFGVSARPILSVFSVLLLLLLVVAPVHAAEAVPIGFGALQQQLDPPAEPVPEPETGVNILVAMSAVVAAIVEAVKRIYVKPLADRNGWSENHYIGFLTALGVILGIGSAFVTGPDADLLRMVGVTFLPPAIGILMSGILIGFGEAFVHWGFDGLRDVVLLLRALGINLSSTPLPLTAQATATDIKFDAPTLLASLVGTPEYEDHVARLAQTMEAKIVARLSQEARNEGGSGGPSGSAPDPIPKAPVPSLN